MAARPGSAAAMLRRVAAEARSMPRQFIDDASKAIKTSVEKRLVGDAGGDKLLSGTNRNGRAKALRVQTTIKGDTTVTAEIKPGPTGRTIAVWSWLERGTKPHMIGARRHPGSPAKRTWSKGVEPAMQQVERAARDRLSKVIGA